MVRQLGTLNEFLALSDRLLELYRAGRFSEALAAVEAEADRFPTRRATVVYWRASLQGALGLPDEALATLQLGLDQGLWWSTRFLEDPDLEALFLRTEFRALKDESERRRRVAPRHEVTLRTHRPSGEPRGLLLPLHGAAWDPDEFARFWAAGAGAGFLVAVPNSSLAMGPEEFTWDEPDGAERDVRRAYELAVPRDEARPDGARGTVVVLGGFSQGGRLALQYALRGDLVPAAGYLGVGPAIRNPGAVVELAAPAAERGLRTAFIVGDRDSVLEPVLEVHASLVEAGIRSELEVVPGLGHWFPEDFAERLPRALEFIAGP